MAKSPVKAALTLAAIVAATQSDTGYLFASATDAAPFITAGHAEQNTGVVNPEKADEFATRATAAGINAHSATSAPEQPAAKPTFAIMEVDAEDVPAKRRGSMGAQLYPFDDLGEPYVGADGKQKYRSFFVPATDKMREPWKSMTSAVSAAARKYATQVGTKQVTKKDGTVTERGKYEYTRKFRLTEHALPDGTKGAIVSRVQ